MRILDSDHCVALLRGTLTLEGRVTCTEEGAPAAALAITSITVGELVCGAYKSTNRDKNLARLDVLLAGLEVLPFDEIAAQQFGILKARLEREGRRLADLDLQIASIALEQGVALLTHNRRHFERIAGLVLEDWLQEDAEG